jgi:hypothetical protein
MHSNDGMAMVLNESFADIPKPPPGFLKCGNFNMDIHHFSAPRCTISGTFPFNHDELRHVASLHKLSPGLGFPLQSMSLQSLINAPLL